MPAIGVTVTLSLNASQLLATLSSGTIGGASGNMTWQFLVRKKGSQTWKAMTALKVTTTVRTYEPLPLGILEIILRGIDDIGATYDSDVIEFNPFTQTLAGVPVIDFPDMIDVDGGNVLAFSLATSPTLGRYTTIGTLTPSLIVPADTPAGVAFAFTKTGVFGISNFALSSVPSVFNQKFATGVAGNGF